ncbi:MAG: autoinducer binding domain-containing protein [Pseudomonadota bacterium]
MEQGRIHADILGTLKSIDTAQSADDTLARYILFVRRFGFSNFLVSQIIHPLRPEAKKAMMHSNWPSELLNKRFEGMNLVHDPVVKYAMACKFRFSWDDAYSHASRFGKLMMDEAKEHKLGEGYTFPMRRPGAPLGGISIGGEGIDVSPQDLSEIELASLHCYSKLESFHPPFPKANRKDLSPQEVDVLHFASVGKSAWETSRIMAISEAAVKDALKRARSKLDAVNTVQACTTAIVRDLIVP